MMRLTAIFIVMLWGVTAIHAQDELQLPITQDVNYEVQIADTLDTIGAVFDVAPSCIAETNDIERGDLLRVGQVLTIAVSCPLYYEDTQYTGTNLVLTPRGEPQDDCSGYRVQRNDTLDTIGQALDVSVEALRQANEIERGEYIFVAQCLVVPAGTPYGTIPATDGGGVASLGTPYTLQIGESLDAIAQRFDVSLRAVEIVNGIDPGRNALPGLTITIPSNAPPYGDDSFDPASLGQGGGAMPSGGYVIQFGETLDTIAQDNDVSRECLIEANDIENAGRIFAGDTLSIPPTCPPYAPYNAAPTGNVTPADNGAQG